MQHIKSNVSYIIYNDVTEGVCWIIFYDVLEKTTYKFISKVDRLVRNKNVHVYTIAKLCREST